MFRQRHQYLDWQPRDGDQVELRATLGLYEARGDLQLAVDSMRRAGAGALFERFQQLRDRLRDEPNISAASTYTDRDTAERVVALALTKSERKIAAWAARGGTRPNLTLNVHVDGEPIGRSIARRGTGAEPCHDAIVVLRARGDAYYVLTSYPEVR